MQFNISICLLLLVTTLFYCAVDAERRAFGSHRLSAYVTDWALPDKIAWNKLDHVIYAFAVPDRNGNLGKFNGDQLHRIVSQAHANHKGCSLSVGGWTGSVHFSSILKTSSGRQRFADNLLRLVNQYKLDGINLDWEYPNGNNGVSCNEVNPYDTENLLAFVQLLRTRLDKVYPTEHKVITAAVAAKVFNGHNQQPLTRLSKAWGAAVDLFFVMAYDLRGNWDTTTGANAPLAGDGITATNAIHAWASAGIPEQQLALGVPFYGYVTRTDPKARITTSMQIPLVRNAPQIPGDQFDSAEKEPCPGANKGVYSGEYQWRSIRRDGILENQGGWHSIWDKTTRTPYSVNRAKSKFLTFDDPKSLRVKAAFVDENDLGGIMLWSLEMDDHENSLLNSLQGVREA